MAVKTLSVNHTINTSCREVCILSVLHFTIYLKAFAKKKKQSITMYKLLDEAIRQTQLQYINNEVLCGHFYFMLDQSESSKELCNKQRL